MKMREFFIVTVFAVALSACSYKVDKNSGVVPDLSSLTSIGYDTVAQYVFKPNCYTCHGFQGGVNTETYANVKTNIAGITSAIDSGRMPPQGPINSKLKALLALWVEKGMPEAPVPIEPGEIGGGEEETPILASNYDSMNFYIFQPKCIGCHASNSERLVPLATREQIIDPSKGLLDFANPENSLLVALIKNRTFPPNPPPEHLVQMPPVLSQLEPVTPEQIETLIEWIRLGAPE